MTPQKKISKLSSFHLASKLLLLASFLLPAQVMADPPKIKVRPPVKIGDIVLVQLRTDYSQSERSSADLSAESSVGESAGDPRWIPARVTQVGPDGSILASVIIVDPNMSLRRRTKEIGFWFEIFEYMPTVPTFKDRNGVTTQVNDFVLLGGRQEEIRWVRYIGEDGRIVVDEPGRSKPYRYDTKDGNADPKSKGFRVIPEGDYTPTTSQAGWGCRILAWLLREPYRIMITR